MINMDNISLEYYGHSDYNYHVHSHHYFSTEVIIITIFTL